MSESIGYQQDKCAFCHGPDAGYQRRKTYAGEGPWLDACQACAEKPYEQPKQFQESIGEKYETGN